MNNKIIVGVIALILIVGGGLFIANQNSQKTDQEKTAMVQTDDAMTESTKKDDGSTGSEKMTDDKMAGSRYVTYSKSAMDGASGNRRVLFFYASWCPTCKPADASFNHNSGKIPSDVTVIRVNYNDPETDQEEKDLAKKYGITYQHTFVQIDSAGKEVSKWNGGQIDELLSNIK